MKELILNSDEISVLISSLCLKRESILKEIWNSRSNNDGTLLKQLETTDKLRIRIQKPIL